MYKRQNIINASFFLPSCVIISAIVALATGSSWSTSATIGIALIGIGKALGFDIGIVAGAVISGAYFGDKMSPLSDTTNLAPAVTGTDLFTHIRHMVWTTAPSFVVALIIFMFLGLGVSNEAEDATIKLFNQTLQEAFNITPITLIPLVLVFYMAIKKVLSLIHI